MAHEVGKQERDGEHELDEATAALVVIAAELGRLRVAVEVLAGDALDRRAEQIGGELGHNGRPAHPAGGELRHVGTFADLTDEQARRPFRLTHPDEREP